MRTKLRIAIAVLVLFVLCAGQAAAFSARNAADEILAYKMEGCSSRREFLDTTLVQTAGQGAEWYVLALLQSGEVYSYGKYAAALRAYADAAEYANATEREKFALLLLFTGDGGAYGRAILDASVDSLGLMSRVYGLHLLNNGCTASAHTADGVLADLLARRNADGGWSILGDASDVDATAMVLQALAPYYGVRAEVTQAVDAALSLLASRQLANGGFMSFGVENAESTAQVLTALACLGLDAETMPAFEKNGSSLLSVLYRYRLEDGSYSHTPGGAANETATAQALYAYTAVELAARGGGSLFVYAPPAQSEPAASAPVTAAPVTESPVVPAETVMPVPESTASAASAALPETTAAAQPSTESAASSAAVPATEESPLPNPVATALAEEDGAGLPSLFRAFSAWVVQVGIPMSATEAAFVQERETMPADEAAPAATPEEAAPKTGASVKWWLSGGVLLVLLAVCLFMLVTKRCAGRQYLLVCACGVLVLAGLWLLPDGENAAEITGGESTAPLTVTLTITVPPEVAAAEGLPADGVLLPAVTYTLSAGASVYEALQAAAAENDLAVINKAPFGAAYISRIGTLGEFDYGNLSGWVYLVNEKSPSVGCSSYSLADGDRIEWRYTVTGVG